MNSKLWLDFESYSEVDLRKHGSLRYAHHESTNVICLGYAFDDELTQLWTPAQEFPEAIRAYMENGGPVYAHNAIFDYRIWNEVLVPSFDEIPTMSLHQCVDTAALCLTYTLPASLAKAGAALNISLPKLEEGVRLINKCCKPNKAGEQPSYFDIPDTFKELFMYCKRDVDAMREIVNTLPRQELLPIEQEVWELTASMNRTGLPVDIRTVRNVLAYLNKYVKTEMSKVATITGGRIQTVGQTQKIRDWCEEKGVVLPNLQAPTVAEAISDERLPEEVLSLLKLRQELGRTSTAKFKKIKELEMDGYVHDNIQYHGSNTGRWAGRGFQMHNLPRAKVPNPEHYIEMFKSKKIIDDPVTIGKALIRPMILAPKGMMLMVSDYSSIENRILAWLAGDTHTLDVFRQGLDQYKDMATHLYKVEYDDVTKAQRQMAKMVVLGCGYQMGWRRFKESAQDWDVYLTDEEAKHIVDMYREKYDLIVDMWNDLKLAGIRAIITGKKQTFGQLNLGTARVNGIRWLAMQLPSGKSIYYMNPSVQEKYIPGYETMGKVPTIMHWGVNPYSKKWSELKVTPGRLTENATQATAREVMAYGMLNVQKNMPEATLIGTVHDEALSLIDEKLAVSETMDKFNLELCTVPWAKDCPLAAEGYFEKRYKKD
jgi:DNA polymerase bacteriophage-type